MEFSGVQVVCQNVKTVSTEHKWTYYFFDIYPIDSQTTENLLSTHHMGHCLSIHWFIVEEIQYSAFYTRQCIIGILDMKYKTLYSKLDGLVSLGRRIHRLHPCRGVRLSQRVSWIWHKTIWWWGFSNAGALGNAEYLFIAIAPRFTLFWSGSTW